MIIPNKPTIPNRLNQELISFSNFAKTMIRTIEEMSQCLRITKTQIGLKSHPMPFKSHLRIAILLPHSEMNSFCQMRAFHVCAIQHYFMVCRVQSSSPRHGKMVHRINISLHLLMGQEMKQCTGNDIIWDSPDLPDYPCSKSQKANKITQQLHQTNLSKRHTQVVYIPIHV